MLSPNRSKPIKTDMNRTMFRPQDIMIGDWLMAEGRVVRVAAVHQRKKDYKTITNRQ